MTRHPILDDRRALLLKYRASHEDDCPQFEQTYWWMRPEDRPKKHGAKPCTCGLDELLRDPDERQP